MHLNMEAIYENGSLKLPGKLALPEGQRVSITIHPSGSAVQRLYGMLSWKGDAEELHRYLDDANESQWERS